MTDKEREEMRQRIVNRLCEAAWRADEALSHDDPMPPWRKELCDAVDDYLAGEELPRNRPAPARSRRPGGGTR